MAVNYICRYCKTHIGSIDNALVSEQQLGLHSLTADERNDMITYNGNGDLVVHLVCDYCNEALNSNPELNLVNNPLQ
ncbi:anti-sigma-F factor Fin [Paenibacillus montaniterrae]|uniref:Anti-sigma-F factor Fin n=1 Tax=Paenibacillus montaniterrae TaxID=429341 RepID=A0A919YUY6_9BACL|nr:anti-sigma-F factor Fin family protein [Paenibacillus montaniterrae]GIP19602.1 anti-sigma-F factor Fin [Paenibacillus montaniterrae]